MSNDDLRKLNERIRLEQEYKKLTSGSDTSKSTGSSEAGVSSSGESGSSGNGVSKDAANAREYNRRGLSSLSNNELKELNTRTTLEKQYKEQHPNKAKKIIAVAATTAAALGTVALLYKNGKQVMNDGKEVWDAYKKKAGTNTVKEATGNAASKASKAAKQAFTQTRAQAQQSAAKKAGQYFTYKPSFGAYANSFNKKSRENKSANNAVKKAATGAASVFSMKYGYNGPVPRSTAHKRASDKARGFLVFTGSYGNLANSFNGKKEAYTTAKLAVGKAVDAFSKEYALKR